MVTEILPYLAISCFLTKQQIRAFQLIINELRFIRCVSLLPVSAVITHVGRHTMATTICLSKGVPIETVSRMLGHMSIRTTQIYAKITNEKISQDMELLSGKLGDLEKKLIGKI